MLNDTESYYYELDTVISFGKYEGYTVKDVFIKRPEYIELCLSRLDFFYIEIHTEEELNELNQKFTFSAEAKKSISSYRRDMQELNCDPHDSTMEYYGYYGDPSKFDDWKDANGF